VLSLGQEGGHWLGRGLPYRDSKEFSPLLVWGASKPYESNREELSPG
jgi:hypothetical protein